MTYAWGLAGKTNPTFLIKYESNVNKLAFLNIKQRDVGIYEIVYRSLLTHDTRTMKSFTM